MGNIFLCDEADLNDFFSQWGNVNHVWVAKQPPGFGYVTFQKEEDAERALREGQGQYIRDEALTIEVARGGVCFLCDKSLVETK